jgi:hypothetical protein
MRSVETALQGSIENEGIIRIARTLLQVPNVAAGKRDPDFVDFCTGHWGTGSVVFFFTLSDVTHVE